MKMMQEQDQAGDAWHAWRGKGLGSSDAPVIMGISPYMTKLQLMEQKLGLRKATQENQAMTYGKIFEPKARARFELDHGFEMPPACGEHAEFPFIRTSFDGLNVEQNVFAEMKYMGKKNFDLCVKNQAPLDHHIPQVQHQFMTSGLETCIYIPYTLTEDKKAIDEIAYIPVKADAEYIEKNLFPEEKAFWEMYLAGELPEPSEKDILHVEEANVVSAAIRFQQISVLQKSLDAELELVKSQLGVLLDMRSVVQVSNIMRISRVVRQGSVDYKKIPELKGVNLDQYRGKVSAYPKFTPVSVKK